MRKLYVPITVTLLFLFSFSPSGILEKDQYDLIIQNINLIDGTGNEMQEGTYFYIRNGKIGMISDKPQVQAQSRMSIDGTGKYICRDL